MYKLAQQMGGPGEIVVVVESHLTMIKLNRRILWNEEKQIWVFRGIEREQKNVLLYRYHRDKEILVNLINCFILLGIQIVSD